MGHSSNKSSKKSSGEFNNHNNYLGQNNVQGFELFNSNSTNEDEYKEFNSEDPFLCK